VAGQMRHAYMRQNEKAAIVNDQPESLLALLGAPTDEAITGFDFPGRPAKEQAGQIASVTVSNKVAQVLAPGTAVAQVNDAGPDAKQRRWLESCVAGQGSLPEAEEPEADPQ